MLLDWDNSDYALPALALNSFLSLSLACDCRLTLPLWSRSSHSDLQLSPHSAASTCSSRTGFLALICDCLLILPLWYCFPSPGLRLQPHSAALEPIPLL